MRMKACPCLREVETPGGAPDQLDAEAFLQRRYPAADCGLRDIKPIRRRRKAARLHHGHKRLQVIETIHIVAYFRTILSINEPLFLNSQR